MYLPEAERTCQRLHVLATGSTYLPEAQHTCHRLNVPAKPPVAADNPK